MTAGQVGQEALREALAGLSRELATGPDPTVLLAEGNVSATLGDGTFLVKASGVQMRHAGPADFVRVDAALMLDGMGPDVDDAGWAEVVTAATSRDASGRRPSIEAPLHAVALEVCGATWVAHTHPTSVNGVLCSARPEALAVGPLFPDQVVVCGAAYCQVPYVDPGPALGHVTQQAVQDHRKAHGEWPRVLLLENHGLVALGSSAAEAMAISRMMIKSADVLHAANTNGGPRYLSPEVAGRLAGRDDEKARRALLA